MDSKERKKWLPKPYLLGFGAARSIAGISDLVGSEEVIHNLYRHPLRQGSRYAEKYSQLDDFYSFGVLLLELAMWTSLVAKGEDGSKKLDEQQSEVLTAGLWKSVKVEPAPENHTRAFREMIAKYVPATMGSRFAEVIETCLTCLESDPAKQTEGAIVLREANQHGCQEVCLAFEERVLLELEEIEQSLSRRGE